MEIKSTPRVTTVTCPYRFPNSPFDMYIFAGVAEHYPETAKSGWSPVGQETGGINAGRVLPKKSGDPRNCKR